MEQNPYAAPTAPIEPESVSGISDIEFIPGKAISFAWLMVKKNLGFYIVLILIYFGFSALSGIVNFGFGQNQATPFMRVPLLLIIYIATYIAALGIIKINLNCVDGKSLMLSDLFSCAHLFFKFIGATLLYSLLVFVGLLLFIVPGIIFGIKYSFYTFFLSTVMREFASR